MFLNPRCAIVLHLAGKVFQNRQCEKFPKATKFLRFQTFQCGEFPRFPLFLKLGAITFLILGSILISSTRSHSSFFVCPLFHVPQTGIVNRGAMVEGAFFHEDFRQDDPARCERIKRPSVVRSNKEQPKSEQYDYSLPSPPTSCEPMHSNKEDARTEKQMNRNFPGGTLPMEDAVIESNEEGTSPPQTKRRRPLDPISTLSASDKNLALGEFRKGVETKALHDRTKKSLRRPLNLLRVLATQALSPPAPVQRSRGRPKGSGNKRKRVDPCLRDASSVTATITSLAN